LITVIEETDKPFAGMAELRLHDGLLRLLELRLEEAERRIRLLEDQARSSPREATT